MDAGLEERARRVLEACRRAGVRLALAEASTGGLLCACLTDIPGSSAVVERGFVPYSNEAKTEQLGVPVELMVAHGAVSEQVARALAEGALARSHADLALGETGIAGPSGGSAAKPVGLVHLAVIRRGGTVLLERHVFPGDRAAIRRSAAARGLELLLSLLERG
ncbi:CinA family protein [Vitiosangium sp. GDMCC 1.1324]|uniref:CinA family protein n=1 Tax=Vitiosangium sp. (strain GDMCC 1.1324) TaxID=2138576 RepID=UPI000D34A251|nr:CinA family protein [Vitiosangium sp. GDMCC 1.1324]PTL83362.1 damage-inducible protein CinA [Vitiosangium sp. GDMCC 1.1324]